MYMLKINHGFFVKPVFGPWYFFCRTSRQRLCEKHRLVLLCSASGPVGFPSVLFRFALVLVRYCFGPFWFPFGSVSVRSGFHSALLRPPMVSIRFCVGSLCFSFGSASAPRWFPGRAGAFSALRRSTSFDPQFRRHFGHPLVPQGATV